MHGSFLLDCDSIDAVFSAIALTVIVAFVWARYVSAGLSPGCAVAWGPFQHGVLLSVGLDGWSKVHHAASGVVFAVPSRNLRRVVL